MGAASGSTPTWLAALAPVCGVMAFCYDGIYIGATWARDMRNLMVASLAVYLAAWLLIGAGMGAGLSAEKILALEKAWNPTDGSPVFSLPMVVGLLIFYAFCLQCAATLAVIYRETNSVGWPVFAWLYMTGLGYAGALLAYQLGS